MSAKQVYQVPTLPTLDRVEEVGVYCRVSTRSQEQLESLAAQVSELVRFVRQAGIYNLYDVYIDIMSGALTENRPAYQRMLSDCKNHNINIIVCKSISRFGRNTAEMLQSVREIKACGVNVYFLLENLNTQDSETEHIMTVIEAYRESENKVKSDNIRMGLKMRAMTGTSGLYRRRCYGYCKDTDGSLKIDPEEAKVVQTIYKIYLEGASINKIVTYLMGQGVKSPTGKEKWYSRTVDEILSNEKYIGDVILVKSFSPDGIGGKRIKNMGYAEKYKMERSHSAIISRETFEAVQAEKKRRSNYEETESGKGQRKKRYTSSFCLHSEDTNDE